MAPSNIFIVRHGERLDHVDPTFSTSTDRPHDPPLTDIGVDSARMLGSYMVTHHGIDLSKTIIMSSPLLRCVQTSHGVLEGIQAATRDTTFLPIYVEPSLAESALWMHHDMLKNPEVAGEGYIKCPDPLWQVPTIMYLNESANVRLLNLFDLHADPKITVENNKLTERHFVARCSLGAKQMLSRPELDDKTVIVITHGETAIRWMYAISQVPMVPQRNPAYTGLMHLTQENGKWAPQMDAFATPHMPSMPTTVAMSEKSAPTPMSVEDGDEEEVEVELP